MLPGAGPPPEALRYRADDIAGRRGGSGTAGQQTAPAKAAGAVAAGLGELLPPRRAARRALRLASPSLQQRSAAGLAAADAASAGVGAPQSLQYLLSRPTTSDPPASAGRDDGTGAGAAAEPPLGTAAATVSHDARADSMTQPPSPPAPAPAPDPDLDPDPAPAPDTAAAAPLAAAMPSAAGGSTPEWQDEELPAALDSARADPQGLLRQARNFLPSPGPQGCHV